MLVAAIEAEVAEWAQVTAGALDKPPKDKQPRAEGAIHNIWIAETWDEANQAFDAFIENYREEYPKATVRLTKGRDVLLIFYDFPAEHLRHLGTTNPIESTFATIGLRHRETKRSGSRAVSLATMFKLAESTRQRWRLLCGSELHPVILQ